MSLQDYSKTLVRKVQITLPWCNNAFGVAPCTATGAACYNTYHTCKDRANFAAGSKTYSFCSSNCPPPFPGPLPYVDMVTYLPTEIVDNLTKTGRVKVDFSDEPASDVGIDPYVLTRSYMSGGAAFAWLDQLGNLDGIADFDTVGTSATAYRGLHEPPGTFFKRFVARNPNYKGAVMEIFEGDIADAEEDYVQTAHILLETGAISPGKFTFESIDLLAGLGELEIPRKVDLKLLVALTATSPELYLNPTVDAASLAASGYLRIDDEIIGYTAYDATQRRVSGLTRGAFGTVADAHTAAVAVQPCRYFAPNNPFQHLLDMLFNDAGYALDLVDWPGFLYWSSWPGGEVNMSALFSEPTKLSKVYMGLVDLLDCKSWVGEDLKITIARNIANAPGRAYVALSDAESVIKNSASVELNEVSRKTRAAVYWEKSVLGRADDTASYSRIDIGVNADAETEYGDTVQETLFTPWLTAAGIQEETMAAYISDLLLRRMFSRRDAAPVIKIALDTKDAARKVGEFVTFTTDELCNPDGTPVSTRFQIVKRDMRPTKLEVKLQRMPARRCCFFAPETALDYVTATAEEREYGGFFSDDQGKMPNGDDGFFFY